MKNFAGIVEPPVKTVNQPIKTGKPFTSPVAQNVQNIEWSLAISYIVAAILQFVMLILRYVPFGKYHVEVKELRVGNDFTFSIAWTMGSIETAIFVTLIIISTVLCILPIIKKSLEIRRRMIFSKIVVFWNALTIGLTILVILNNLESAEKSIAYNYGEEVISSFWNLTFGGWLNIIITLATIVLLFVISRKTKKYRNK